MLGRNEFIQIEFFMVKCLNDFRALSLIQTNGLKMNSVGQGKRTSFSRYAQNSSCDANGMRRSDLTRSSRINYSPLRNPLESAVSKVVTTFVKDTASFGDKKRIGAVSPGRFGSTPRSKILNVSSSRNINNFSVDNYDENKEALENMHPEPMEFLKKYFSGYTATQVPSATFVDFLSKEYSTLWSETQAQAVFPQFAQKLMNKLGQQYVSIYRLYQLTRENGLIGLILGIFRELKNEQDFMEDARSSAVADVPSSRYIIESRQTVNSSSPELQNVKNIIQEFTQGLYKSTENQIYAKLNSQMRKLVLKYKQTEGILKTINDKINQDIDKIHYGRKKAQLEKTHELAIECLNEKLRIYEADLNAERALNANLRLQNEKYSVENRRLTQTVDKFQNHLLKKGQEDSARKVEQTKFVTKTVHCITSQPSTPVTFAYQTSKQILTGAEQRKGLTIHDKENIVSLHSLNGVVKPTTPLKGTNRPSVSPNRLLKITRH